MDCSVAIPFTSHLCTGLRHLPEQLVTAASAEQQPAAIHLRYYLQSARGHATGLASQVSLYGFPRLHGIPVVHTPPHRSVHAKLNQVCTVYLHQAGLPRAHHRSCSTARCRRRGPLAPLFQATPAARHLRPPNVGLVVHTQHRASQTQLAAWSGLCRGARQNKAHAYAANTGVRAGNVGIKTVDAKQTRATASRAQSYGLPTPPINAHACMMCRDVIPCWVNWALGVRCGTASA